MKKFFAYVFVVLSSQCALAQNYYLSGVVTDVFDNAIDGAGIFIKNSNFFTYTNDTGFFKLLLPKGTFTIIVEKKGYISYSSKLTIGDEDKAQNFSLESDKIKEVAVIKLQSEKIDLSKEIIRSTVDKKDRFRSNINYSATAFIKASLQTQTQKLDSATEEYYKDTTQSALAQVYLKIDVGENGKIKEERLGVKKQGDIYSLYWLTATEGWVSVYDNLLKLEGVCDVPVISPVSNTGLISYRYETEAIWFENGKKFYQIKVRPIKLGNALGTGYLIVEDTSFLVHKLVLQFPNMHLPEYDRFALVQYYEYPNDSTVLLTRQEFKYNFKSKDAINYGSTEVTFDSFNFNMTFGKRHFGAMMSLTTKKAYEQDSNFWESVRTEDLSQQEALYERKLDSIKSVEESIAYKDSMQQEFNRFTLKKVFLLGQGHYNHEKERLIMVQPLLFSFQPVMIAGARVGSWVSYNKQYSNKRMLQLYPNLSYGLRNKDVKGSFRGYYLFDPIRRKSVSFNLSRDFEIINPFDAWINIFRRSNFYQSDNISLNYRQELVNGLFFTVGAGFSDRKSISTYNFNPLGDSLFLAFGDSNRNKAIQFQPYKALYNRVSLEYTPGQKYMLEPNQKIILGSKWPTFGIRFEKGTPKLLSSAVDYDFIEFDIEQRLKLGLLGRLNYRFNTGKFMQMRDLRIVDYKFQPNSNPYLFTNPNYTFQRLDSVYRTFDWFYEGHILHRFNGAILNKIPLLKKLQMVETVGGGFLYSPENNLRYIEAFAGLEKVIKILDERFRIGIYVVGAEANKFATPVRLKFSIEYFNRQDNTWMF